ncbi:hypothetical protein RSAG8_05185, partial [Rhizoctonia solani AG-8 WAC10335]
MTAGSHTVGEGVSVVTRNAQTASLFKFSLNSKYPPPSFNTFLSLAKAVPERPAGWLVLLTLVVVQYCGALTETSGKSESGNITRHAEHISPSSNQNSLRKSVDLITPAR